MKWRARLMLALAFAAADLAGCRRARAPAEPIGACLEVARPEPPRRRPVVLVLADTLRRDRLGIYGGPAHTPHLDAFGRSGTVFDAAWSQAPWTKPSVATLFTGLYPSQHRVLSHPDLRAIAHQSTSEIDSDLLDGHFETLAETLHKAGYDTAAFVSNPWLLPSLGFAQGFQLYDDHLAGNDTPGTVVSAAALDWLHERESSGRQEPFFLYVHYMDVHAPYARVSEADLRERRAAIEADKRPVSREAQEQIAALALDESGRPIVARGIPANLALMELVYDQGVEQLDRGVGLLLDGLAASPLARDAAVIVVADHGEALFQRGYRGHGYALFAASTAVPFLAHLPGVHAPARVSCPIGLVDVRATLCDYLGLSCSGTDAGQSLFDHTVRPRFMVSEGVIGRPHNRVLRGKHWTLIAEPDGRAFPFAPKHQIFSLFYRDSDPRELHDVSAGQGNAARAMQMLSAALPDAVPEAEIVRTRRVRLDEVTRERLKALGYLDETH